MTREDWLSLFPQGSVTTSYPINTSDTVFQIDEQHFLIINSQTLTSREKALLSLIPKQQPAVTSLTPWQRYLEQGGTPPSIFHTLQFIHIAILPKNNEFNELEWIRMMSDLLGHTIASFRCFNKHYTFILDAKKSTFTEDSLTHIHETIEEDFAISMTLFLGNQWFNTEQLSQLYQAEKALFVSYLHESNRQKLLTFSSTVIWGLTHPKINITPIPSVILSTISDEHTTDIIDALWKEHGVLTKTASALYLHRNTLQYRIDRFTERSGIHLKNMDDLTLCYLLLHQQNF